MKSPFVQLCVALFMFIFVVSCSKTDNDDPGNPSSYEINVSLAPATIEIPNLVEVLIPQGAFEGSATFKISTVQASSLPASTDFEMIETYEITSTSGKTFAKDLEITIKYDPLKGQKDVNLNGAAYYHEDLKKWIPFSDVIIDAEKSEIRIKSNHLTKLGRFSYTKLLGYTDWSSSLHFTYYWNEPGVLDNTKYISPYKDVNVGADPHYIQDIRSYMEASYAAFKKANLNLPSGKINVYIKKLDSGTDGMTSFLGNIYISESIENSNYATTAEALPMVCSHELLHYVQDYYYMQLFSDYTVKWWLEATAVQADRYVWPANKKFEVIEYGQNLSQNLTTSWDDCNNDPGYYIAGNFLSYLISYRAGTKLELPDLIKEGGKAGNISFMRTILDQMIKSKLGSSGIGEEYANFIKWAVDGKSDIKLTPQRPTPTPVYPNFKNAILTGKFQNEKLTASTPRLAVTFFKGLNNTKEKLEMIAKLDAKSDQLIAWAYKMNSNGTATFLKEVKAKDSVIVELADNQEWAEIVCVNKTKDDEGFATVKFSFNTMPHVTAISPQKAKAGELVSIQGSNLGTGVTSSIFINNQSVNLTKYLKSWTNSLIQFIVPENASSGQIYVTNSGILSNKQTFEFIKTPPILDKIGIFMGTTYFPGYQPWGGYDQYSKTIYIFGKNWSTDPAKTFVKVNGNIVPITGYSGTTLPDQQLSIDMPAINGNFTITVESEGMESEPKNFYKGIPPEILHKMPLMRFLNQFMATYNDYQDNNKPKTHSCSFTIAKDYNTLESYSWSGNTLTIVGKGAEYIGTHNVVLTFNEFGTMVTKVEVDVKSLNTDIKYILNNLKVELWGMYNQLKFVRAAIPASAYQSVSGTRMTTEPRYVFNLTGMAENYPSWPNEFAVWFEFKN
jgi:hypothetical protein